MTSVDAANQKHWGALCAALETEHGSAYVLSPELKLRYVNDAFRRFARDNGAPELADWESLEPIPEYITLPLRELFATRLRLVLQRGAVWEHVYECSSPSTYRKFKMRVEVGPSRSELIVVHTQVSDMPLADLPTAEQLRSYLTPGGVLLKCAACGRLRRTDDLQRWEWVAGVGSLTSNLSHGICPVCSFQHYGI